MMIHTLRAALGAACLLTTVSVSTPAAAQFGHLKKKLERKAERAVEKKVDDTLDTAIDDALNGTPQTVSGASLSNTPKPTSITQCDSLRPSKITVGKLGSYTFQNGMSREDRTGFIDRRDVAFESGCILPNMTSGDILYVEYDTAALKAKGWGGAYETQCIKIDDQGPGAINSWEGRGDYPSNDSYLGEAHMRLACGNSEGISDCTSGSNGDRASAMSADLKARGKTALSFRMMSTMRTDMLGPQERLYCQYYNTESGLSLFGYEYLRVRG